ncbi:unnamed protein product [Prorocentrum cordatum]|uniref:PDZ domain-containing protein n=1 Tax=Prorocentrum cordatum TaxID=2364126 RepID=A0ABN9PK22_9DINO|nr:unnamed protein product [Polarella glacialis]
MRKRTAARGGRSGREPPLGDGPVFPQKFSDARDPCRCCVHVAASMRKWWLATTDKEYLSSPTSRRSSWKYDAAFVRFPLTAGWLALMWTGVLPNDSEQWVVAWVLVSCVLFASLQSCLPVTELWVDFVSSSFYCIVTCVLFRRLPTTYALGVMQLPMYSLWVWASGIHVLFVTQYVICGCICIWCAAPDHYGYDMSTATVSVVLSLVNLVFTSMMDIQIVYQYHRVKKLVKVCADGVLTVNATTGVIVGSDREASDLLGESLAGSQLHAVIRDRDCAHVREWLKQSAADPSEGLMVTLRCRHNGECEVRFIPYDVVGPLVHVCFQLVGEVRSIYNDGPRAAASGSGSRPEQPPEVGGSRLTLQRNSDTCSFDPSSTARNPRPQQVQEAPSEHKSEVSALSSLAISKTTPSAWRRVPRTRTVEVQTLPTEPSPRPPSMPELSRDVETLRRAGVPWACRAKRRVRLNTTRRQVPAFAETPKETVVMRLRDAIAGINVCGRGCCAGHVCAASARRALEVMLRGACHDVEFGDRQCPECLALIDQEADAGELQECETCGAEICPLPPTGPASAGSSPSPSSDEAAPAAQARVCRPRASAAAGAAAGSLPPGGRASAESAPALDEALAAFTFRVTVDRSDGTSLGIDIDTRDGSAVLVERVTEGLFAQWNDRNEEARVREGDYLVQANGISGNADRIVAECGEFKPLEILVWRKPMAREQHQVTG